MIKIKLEFETDLDLDGLNLVFRQGDDGDKVVSVINAEESTKPVRKKRKPTRVKKETISAESTPAAKSAIGLDDSFTQTY